jgi:ETFB lysine methyltransferase
VTGEPRQRLTFWWEATGAAWALARALEQGPALDGLRALELGCGPGLVGIAAGLRGAHVTFSDGETEALQLAERNAREAGLGPDHTAFVQLDWEQDGGERTAPATPYDLVLGAEIAYDYWVHGDLVRVLTQRVAPGGTAWLADRPRLAIDRFLGRLRSAGLVAETEVLELDEPGFPPQRVALYRLRHR